MGIDIQKECRPVSSASIVADVQPKRTFMDRFKGLFYRPQNEDGVVSTGVSAPQPANDTSSNPVPTSGVQQPPPEITQNSTRPILKNGNEVNLDQSRKTEKSKIQTNTQPPQHIVNPPYQPNQTQAGNYQNNQSHAHIVNPPYQPNPTQVGNHPNNQHKTPIAPFEYPPMQIKGNNDAIAQPQTQFGTQPYTQTTYPNGNQPKNRRSNPMPGMENKPIVPSPTGFVERPRKVEARKLIAIHIRNEYECRLAITELRKGNILALAMDSITDQNEVRGYVEMLIGASCALRFTLTKISKYNVYIACDDDCMMLIDRAVKALNPSYNSETESDPNNPLGMHKSVPVSTMQVPAEQRMRRRQ